ncbi:MAG TPA: FHA domain-containing protein [Solirubrobacterales bacterium]
MALTLKIGKGAREIELGERELIVGREDCDVTIEDDDEISRRHAAIKPLPGGGAEVTDLGSRNGTLVDGDRIEGPRRISGGETIRVGQTEIATEAVPPPAGVTRISESPGPAPTVAGAPVPPAAEPPRAEPRPAAPAAPPPPPPPAAAQTPPRFGAPGGPPPPGRRKRGPGLWLWLLSGGIVLVLAAAAAWFFLIRDSAEDQIDEAVERVFVTADPGACDFFTANFYEEAAGLSDQTPEEAEQACRDAEDVVPSDSATVTGLEIDGDTATGTIEFTVDGEDNTADATFADEDGWKIDSLELGG